MNKTIYLRDEEVPIWERARELAGDKLSPVIVAALRQFIAERDAEAKGFERIVLEFNDSEDHNLPKRKAFYGRWVLPPENPYPPPPLLGIIENTSDSPRCAVAVTAKGNAVFFSWEEKRGGGKFNFRFEYFDSLESAAHEASLNRAARKAIEKIGVPVEELDI